MPKVLIADDSMAVRKVAERLLVQAGLEVALASSGEEALAWLAKEKADLIISDVIMPGRNGYDVCSFVRSQADLADTPVLLISGIVNEEVTKQVELCRANGVLKKPFQGSSLQDKVKELLALRQSGAQPAPAQQPATAAPPPPPPPPVASPARPAAPAFAFSSSPSPNPAPEQQPVAAAPAYAPPPSPPPPPVASPAWPAAPAPSIDPTQTTRIDLSQATKVYRITEEKLQAFRQAVGRVKELESALAEEQAQSARLYEQLEIVSQQGSSERVQQLEALLAEERQRSAQLVKRAEELERALAVANERISQIAKLVQGWS
jgi:CheY-like chemotaxis protein